MMRCNNSLSYCSDSLTTSRGTYTFHQEHITKAAATKFCEAKGQILAPITSKEEFDTIHNHMIKCRNLCGPRTYHIGLYIMHKDLKFFSNCEKWDPEKHEKLYYYDDSLDDSNCYQTYYSPYNDRMSAFVDPSCGRAEFQPICFQPAGENNKNSEALTNSKSTNIFTSSGFLIAVGVLVSTSFCVMAIALFISVRKFKNLKQRLPVSTS